MAGSMNSKASVLTYMDLLKQFRDPGHSKVQEYLARFADDQAFQDRVRVLNTLVGDDSKSKIRDAEELAVPHDSTLNVFASTEK